ncbi:hypothetical protein OC834_003006 [Tilletia horrida]|nr:hypothetical protein OC834_003006 [Tilletia horrida]
MSAAAHHDNDDTRSIDSVSDYGAELEETAITTARVVRPPLSPRQQSHQHQSRQPLSPPLPSSSSISASASPSTPPLRPQRSVRNLANGSKSPPMAITPGAGRSPRHDFVDLPVSHITDMPVPAVPSVSAAVAAAAASLASVPSASTTSDGLGITTDEPDAAIVARAEAAAIAQAEAESRPRTLSGVRALAKERARLRKEAALAAVNASVGMSSSTAGPTSSDSAASLGAGDSSDDLTSRDGNKARRRQASRQDTLLRDALQASIEAGVSPPAKAAANELVAVSEEQHRSAKGSAHSDISSDNARMSVYAALPAQQADVDAAVAAAGANVAGEFAQLDAALTSALDDLSFNSGTSSVGTIRASATPSKAKQPGQSQHPVLQDTQKAPVSVPSESQKARQSQALLASSQQPRQQQKSQPHDEVNLPSSTMPAPPPASVLASRERAPKASGPVPQYAFMPALPASASQPQHANAPASAPAATPLIEKRRNTLPPPTDHSGHLLIYGKSIPYPEPFLNNNVPGMNAPERRRILLGNNNFNPMSISAPSVGLIHPTVERAKSYAAKTNALFAIETGLDVWVRAMGATRPGARNAYLKGGAGGSASSSSIFAAQQQQQQQQQQYASRRASAHAGIALGGMSSGGPVSAAAAAYKQSLAGLNFATSGSGSGPAQGSRQLASGRAQSISAAAATSHYAQFGGPSHPNRREEPSVATIRSDITFPMRGDGGRAKDITPLGHGVNIGSTDSADSRDGSGFVGAGGRTGGGAGSGLPPQPESPPNAPPRNLPYPGVLAYQGRTNSALSTTTTVSMAGGDVGVGAGAGAGGGGGAREIPARKASIDLLPGQARAIMAEAAVAAVSSMPGSAAMRVTGSSTSASSSARTGGRGAAAAGAGSGAVSSADIVLGPAPSFEPAPTHGPRLPRTGTLYAATAAGAGALAGVGGTQLRKAGSGSGSSSPNLPSSSGATTPKDAAARTPALAKLRLDPLDPLGIGLSGPTMTAGGGSSVAAGIGPGWAEALGMSGDLATPGSGTTYMSAVSHSSALGGGNGVGASNSSPALSSSPGAGAGPGRHAKVLGPRAPKLSLSGVQAFEAYGITDGGASSASAGAGTVSSPSALSNQLNKRPSLTADKYGTYGAGSAGQAIASPLDVSPHDRAPSPSPSLGRSLSSGLPGATFAPPPPLPGSAGKNSPSVLQSPSAGSNSSVGRRPSAATGFIPVGVSSTVRKASFGGKEVSHSRDFFYSDLGRKTGALGDAEGFGEEPIYGGSVSPTSGSSPVPIAGSGSGNGAGNASGTGPSLLSPPGTPGIAYSSSPGSGSARSRTLSRSGSSAEIRLAGANGLSNSVDTLPGSGSVPPLPRSPSLADTSIGYRAFNSSSSMLSYGSVRQSSSGASTVGSKDSGSKKTSKRMQFEETLSKMQDVIPDADRDVLARYLEKANGNDLTAMAGAD